MTRGDARSVWRSLSTPFLDSFASSGRKHHNSLRDLRMVWDDAPDLRAVDARDADAYLGSITPLNLFPNSWPGEQDEAQTKKCQSVRVEHVFFTTDDVIMGMGPQYGALDVPILQSALSLQDTIQFFLRGNNQSDLRCVQSSHSSECLTLSPLSFWQQDAGILAADSSPTTTLLGSTLNVTRQGIPLSLTTTLAGRSHLFSKLPRAEHLAMTFFLQETEECRQSGRPSEERQSKSHAQWLAMLRNITGGQVGILSSEINVTKEVILQFVPVHSAGTLATQRFLLASGYLAVFIWLSKSLMKIQNVHSRFGLAFTGVIELVISMTLAISICALCGVRLTLVPWEILPFVVVVIGSENMFVLTNAIISTPISLTVSARVATGLEKVGVPIAVTVMSDVLLMTTIMMLVDVRAVREFCIFAIFSLFVDFFMQMTLYSTVLSIDLQRLELADLLSQGGQKEAGRSNALGLNNVAEFESNGSDPSASVDGQDDPFRSGAAATAIGHGVGGSFIKMSCRAMWRARTARTASLSLLMAFMFGIYLYHGSGYPSHHSYPFVANETRPLVVATSTQTDSETPRFDPFSHLSRNDSEETSTLPLPWWHTSPSASFWHSLNPDDATSVRVKIEPWTVISLRSNKTFEGAQRSVAHFASWAIFRPRVRAIIWFFKLVVLPISGTTGLLWVLLLYLLKDTELLEAQQNRLDTTGGDDEDEETVEPKEEERRNELDAILRISNNNHTSDVELVCQSGGIVVSLATDSSLSTWRPSKRGNSTAVVLSSIIPNYSRVTAMEVDDELDLIALGHATGFVSLLTLSSLQPIEMTNGAEHGNGHTAKPTSRVQSLFIFAAVPNKSAVFSAHRDGSVWRWCLGRHHMPLQLLTTQAGGVWMAFTPLASQFPCRDILALSSSDHRFQMHRMTVEAPYLRCLLSVDDTASVIRCATVSTLVFCDEEQSRSNTWATVVAGTSRGSIVVYDLISGRLIGQYDILDGVVTNVRAIDFLTACPLLSYVGNRDIILVNSTTRASVMAICTPNDHSPVLSASKSPGLTPLKKKSGPPETTAPVLANESWSPSPKDLAVNGHGNDSNGMLFETPSTPLPLAVPNGSRHRRLSSQGKRVEDVVASNPFLLGEAPLPTASTIGSGNGSLGRLDSDPFELQSNHGDSLVQWSRLASIECARGSADVVLSARGAKVVGVRRRAKPNLFLSATDTRWEVFQLEMDVFYTDRRSLLFLEATCIRRSRLELDEGPRFDSTDGGTGTNTPSGRSIRFAPLSRPHMPLSFTRLGKVQAFYKDRVVAQDERKKTSVIFPFANSVAAVHLYPSPSPP